MFFLSGLLLTIFLASPPAVSGAELFDTPLGAFARAVLRKAVAERKNAALSSDFATLMESVSAQSPLLAEELENAPRAELLQHMLDGMSSGIRRKDRTAQGEQKAPPSPRRGKTIFGNRILYLPLYSLSDESSEQLAADCTAAARLAVKPAAAVLDLRHASGGTMEALRRAASVFLDGGYFSSQPLAVLTSSRTCGAPELLAVLLERGKNTVTLGEAGAGRLYPEIEIQAAGAVWLVPVIAPEFRDIPPLPHRPMIVSPAGTPVDYRKLGDPDALRNDTLLRKAADLLFSLSVLEPRSQRTHAKGDAP